MSDERHSRTTRELPQRCARSCVCVGTPRYSRIALNRSGSSRAATAAQEAGAAGIHAAQERKRSKRRCTHVKLRNIRAASGCSYMFKGTAADELAGNPKLQQCQNGHRAAEPKPGATPRGLCRSVRRRADVSPFAPLRCAGFSIDPLTLCVFVRAQALRDAIEAKGSYFRRVGPKESH